MISLWCRTLLHHRPSQLMWRLYYRISHMMAEMFPALSRWRLEAPCRRLVPELLEFPTRWPAAHLATQNIVHQTPQHYIFCFLNKTLTLPLPFSFKDPRILEQSHLWVFHLHSMDYLPSFSDEECFEYITQWIEEHPPYTPLYWKYSWHPYVVSQRTWIWMHEYHRRTPSGEIQERWLRSIYQQLVFLSQHIEYDLGGNHLIKNLKTLISGAYFFGSQSELYPFQNQWIQKLLDTLKEQILEDGMHFERSLSYHQCVFMDLLELYPFFAASQQSQLMATLSKMAQVIHDFRHPDGTSCAFNDANAESLPSADACLTAWNQINTTHPLKNHKHLVYPMAGYYGYRDAEHFLMLDAGPIGPDHLPAHAHGDIFSFEWSIEGERIIVDTGVFAYQHPLYRPLSRSTRAHNTVTLGGADQAEFWGDFRVGRLPRIRLLDYQRRHDGFYIKAEHDGYTHLPGAPRHQREYSFDSQTLRVTDTVIGGQAQRACAHLHLRHDWNVALTATGACIHLSQGRLHLHTSAPISVHPSLNFPQMGHMNVGWTLVFDYGNSPTLGGFTLKYEPSS